MPGLVRDHGGLALWVAAFGLLSVAGGDPILQRENQIQHRDKLIDKLGTLCTNSCAIACRVVLGLTNEDEMAKKFFVSDKPRFV
jgi:hypothetical protein